MKKATVFALVATAIAGGFMLMCSLESCTLRNPPPCQGDPYPAPCLARDAGDGG